MADHLLQRQSHIERLSSQCSSLKLQLENEAHRVQSLESSLQRAHERERKRQNDLESRSFFSSLTGSVDDGDGDDIENVIVVSSSNSSITDANNTQPHSRKHPSHNTHLHKHISVKRSFIKHKFKSRTVARAGVCCYVCMCMLTFPLSMK